MLRPQQRSGRKTPTVWVSNRLQWHAYGLLFHWHALHGNPIPFYRKTRSIWCLDMNRGRSRIGTNEKKKNKLKKKLGSSNGMSPKAIPSADSKGPGRSSRKSQPFSCRPNQQNWCRSAPSPGRRRALRPAHPLPPPACDRKTLHRGNGTTRKHNVGTTERPGRPYSRCAPPVTPAPLQPNTPGWRANAHSRTSRDTQHRGRGAAGR